MVIPARLTAGQPATGFGDGVGFGFGAAFGGVWVGFGVGAGGIGFGDGALVTCGLAEATAEATAAEVATGDSEGDGPVPPAEHAEIMNAAAIIEPYRDIGGTSSVWGGTRCDAPSAHDVTAPEVRVRARSGEPERSARAPGAGGDRDGDDVLAVGRRHRVGQAVDQDRDPLRVHVADTCGDVAVALEALDAGTGACVAQSLADAVHGVLRDARGRLGWSEAVGIDGQP